MDKHVLPAIGVVGHQVARPAAERDPPSVVAEAPIHPTVPVSGRKRPRPQSHRHPFRSPVGKLHDEHIRGPIVVEGITTFRGLEGEPPSIR